MTSGLEIVEGIVGPVRDRLFVDVGAGTGTSCVTALTALGFRHALAIEPDPENHRLLMMSRDRNGLADRLKVLHAAASETRLDAVLAAERLPPASVGVVRIDAPGSERSVLEGGANLLQAGVPLIVHLSLRSSGQADRCAAIAGLLRDTYTHFYPADKPLKKVERTLDQLTAFGGRLEHANRSVDIVIVRRP
jgi:hypothetical protein